MKIMRGVIEKRKYWFEFARIRTDYFEMRIRWFEESFKVFNWFIRNTALDA